MSGSKRSTKWTLRRVWLVVACLLTPLAGSADELSSASYRHRAGSVVSASAAGASSLSSVVPGTSLGPASVNVGAAPLVAPAGRQESLASLLPGFWALVRGAFPTLDLDGDLAQFFLDPDDDGDALLDVHETGTGLFVSATNTGSSPVDADSDDDGFDDGTEVLAATDPNSRFSFPGLAEVPSLAAPMALGLSILLLGVATLVLRRSSGRRAC